MAMQRVALEIMVDKTTDPVTINITGQEIIPGVGKYGEDYGSYELTGDLPGDLDTDMDSWFPDNQPAP